VDHVFTLAANEQAWHFNVDINATQYLIARPNARGFDLNQQVAIALSRPLHGRLQFSGEVYGNTRLNNATPRVCLILVGPHLHRIPEAGNRWGL
jgi:hypothetical protein